MQRINKEIFPVYGGKCLPIKTVHNWVEKFSQGRSKVADDARPGVEVPETTVKRFAGFDAPSTRFECKLSICELFTDSPFYM
jgi:hypothetical protein